MVGGPGEIGAAPRLAQKKQRRCRDREAGDEHESQAHPEASGAACLLGPDRESEEGRRDDPRREVDVSAQAGDETGGDAERETFPAARLDHEERRDVRERGQDDRVPAPA